MPTYDSDICIYGATSGGIMSAWKAARMGMTISIISNNNHIGGMTTGGLSFLDSSAISKPTGDLYTFFNLIQSKDGEKVVNPLTKGWKTPRPEIAPSEYLQAFQMIFNNYKTLINLYKNQRISGITMLDKKITRIQMTNFNIFTAKIFIDASYEGDLLKYSGVPYSMIRESSDTYGETTQAGVRVSYTIGVEAHKTAGDTTSEILGANINGIRIPTVRSNETVVNGQESKDLMENTYRLCITNTPSKMIPFTDPAILPPASSGYVYKAEDYEILIRYCEYSFKKGDITLDHPMPNGLTYSWPKTSPDASEDQQGTKYHDWNGNYWLVGMSRDYLEDNSGNIDYNKREQIEKASEWWQRGFMYTLATNTRVPLITRNSVSQWGLAKDEFKTNRNWPTCFYLREGRRMKSDYILKNVADSLSSRHVISESKYMLDAHACSLIVKQDPKDNKFKFYVEGGIPDDRNLKNTTIPYETIIPPRDKCTNLFVTWSISASRLTFASIRMEPVFMQIGLVAGAAAALCIQKNLGVQDLLYTDLETHINFPKTDSDICIYGATSGGIMSAWKAARMGMTISIISNNNHIGGMTSGGLTALDYGIRKPEGDLYTFFNSAEAIDPDTKGWKRKESRPGAADVIQTRPSKYLTEFNKIINSSTKIKLYKNQRICGITMVDNKIKSIQMTNTNIFTAKIFIDATYEGDLLKYSGVPYSMVRESRDTYNEDSAGAFSLIPYRVDAYNTPDNPTTGIIGGLINGIQIPKVTTEILPEGEESRNLMEYTYRLCITDRPAAEKIGFGTQEFKPPSYNSNHYKFVVRHSQTRLSKYLETWDISSSDATDFNGNYWLEGIATDYLENASGNIDYPRRTQIETASQYWQRGVLYTLATHPDINESIRNAVSKWGLAKDEFKTNSNWPTCFYVREGRRMKSDYILTNVEDPRASQNVISQSIYFIDSHGCSIIVKASDKKLYSEGWLMGIPDDQPKNKTIPYETIIPPRDKCTNLFVTWSISASRLTFTSIRMEPVFMQISLAAGAAAALCINGKYNVQDLPYEQLSKYMSCTLSIPYSITSFEPFESLSVIRQSRGIPMLFGFRIGDGALDNAGMPIQNTENKVKILQIARYAFDTFRVKHNTSLNQYCLPTNSLSNINDNFKKFYYDNRLKNGGCYGLGEGYTGWYNKIQYELIRDNTSLSPAQKKDQFRNMIRTSMARQVRDYELDKQYLHYIISNEDIQHHDENNFPTKFIEQIKLFSGIASPTLKEVLDAQKDYIAECFKHAYDAFPRIADRKFLYIGGYNMEQRATTLKEYLDLAKYINDKYHNVVHGLMIQGHIGILNFTPKEIEEKLRKIEKLINIARNSGYDVSIYEFDHKIFDEHFYRELAQKVNEKDDNNHIIVRPGEHRVPIPADYIRQADIYRKCLNIFLNQGVCQFQVWDSSDSGSWQNKKHYTKIDIGPPGNPQWRDIRVGDNVRNISKTQYIIQRADQALFYDDLTPKPCYNEIVSLLKNYNVSHYDSKKSIFYPYNPLNLGYSDLASLGD
uniref:GH10 domain-containing protein n=1 Tax=viral metagenome TaxID=1070528 RepID=A0A6C0IFT8_9ZZZZ